MFFRTLILAALVSTAANAQRSDDDCVPCGGPIRDAGTYVLATGELIPPGHSKPPSPNLGVVYDNTCPTPFFSALLNGTTVIDDGRIPSATSPAPFVGTLNDYKLSQIEIQYCTRDLTGVFQIRLRIWESLAMNAASCTSLAQAGVPTIDYTLNGLPGSSSTGAITCWTLLVDLSGFEPCLRGDANGAFDADLFGNGFGYGLTLLHQTGTATSSVGGFTVAGGSSCANGDGTYFSNPFATDGSGLDDDVTFYRDGQGGQTSGCLTFGGPATGALGYHLKLWADLADCAYCPGNPDGDGDGVLDCLDACPNDPLKTAPGQCGCGTADTDSDGDGTADCNDLCPTDASKIAPGVCGCGVPDVDTDGDGVLDCQDACPNDPLKTAPGQCGCGIADTDSDGDGTADCNDLCPFDPAKIAPGQCGCGVADFDLDGDGIADCVDNCPSIANPDQADCNHNGIGDVCDLASHHSLDVDSDSVPDECEAGPGVAFCFGDGSSANCPCANSTSNGEGCANSSGSGALLYNFGGASVGLDDTKLYAIRLPANKFGLVFMGTHNPNGVAFGDGLRCVAGFIKRFNVQNSGANGVLLLEKPASKSSGLIVAGTTWYFQVWYRDVHHASCSSQFNLSNALGLDFAP